MKETRKAWKMHLVSVLSAYRQIDGESGREEQEDDIIWLFMKEICRDYISYSCKNRWQIEGGT